ncbi:beta-alanine-activating enzyme isoform X1 [Anthonomus grandis grandis]|uniref:beta-alanine-activating enzyme isoform X1 n=1 Tax=Anthonomus grandis grandis TaxID=2921223 RepID=UPI0021653E3C|nr:beta-alanine-activating enzyme isoform X1 [Anthonomus grandis grandis]
MEILKSGNVLKAHIAEKAAVIYCSSKGIIKEYSFKTVVDTAHQIKQFILKASQTPNPDNRECKYGCFGLLMNKSPLVPSLLICFQDLNSCFAFLTPNTLKDTVKLLNFQWIISTESSSLLNNHFSNEGTLDILPDESLILWRNLSKCQNEFFKDIFCVQYTSGTTGESKTVRIPVKCIESNVVSLNKHFKITSNDRIYWGTPVTFDPTLVELILGLSCGATLVMVSTLTQLNSTLLYQALFKVSSVTFLQMVPSIFLRWNKKQISQILLQSSLKVLALGGERFPQEILGFERHSDLRLYNLYGVTELSCWATIEDLSAYDFASEVPLGECLDEVFINIEHVDGNAGEIWIGSNTRYCLLSNEDATKTFPFKVQTGDLGEIKNGKVYFRGRKTRLVKRLGHKILLPKLEEQIFSETGLHSRLVYSYKRKKLLVFVILEEQFDKYKKSRVLDKMRVKLLQFLPEHACPDYFDVLTHFPVNKHGKICDKLLERIYDKAIVENIEGNCPPDKIFEDCLGIYLRTDLSNKDFQEYSFFELGGNSILAIQLLNAFEIRIGKEIPKELFNLLINDRIGSCLSYVSHHLGFKRKMYQEKSEDVNMKKIFKCEEHASQLDCIRWKYNLKGCVDSSPLAFQYSEKIYVACGSFAQVFAIISETEQNYATFSLLQEIEAKPSISDDGSMIYIGCNNGFLYAIDMKNKQVTWEYQTSQPVKCSALLSEGNLVFGSYSGDLYSLQQKNGAVNWQINLSGSIKADPIQDCLKQVYVGTTRGVCYCIKIEDGNILWTNTIEGPIFGTPCIVNDNSIWPCVTGKVYCILSSGIISWTVQAEGHIFSSLIPHYDQVFFNCLDSYLYKIETNQRGLSKHFQLKSETTSSPFLYNFKGKLFIVCVSNSGILTVIEGLSKKCIFNLQLPSQSFSTPYVKNENVYVGCRDNNLYCINIENCLKN